MKEIERIISEVKFEYYDEEGAVLEEVNTMRNIFGDDGYEVRQIAKAIEQYVIKARIEELENATINNFEMRVRIAELKKGVINET